ncbi:hypothetical protein GDO86_005372 [Hymenochirus boettgeri]|uniref:Uncharacterized protein n=1 Tax=Hymenochirus boettgeri TaxID=247094 RepID=A0A8T2J4A1_9PIPI|nr:hypothetical protein GDO86_005372 [Hymenochirus boettgeri]
MLAKRTGGGPYGEIPLTDYDKQLYAVMGPEVVTGLARPFADRQDDVGPTAPEEEEMEQDEEGEQQEQELPREEEEQELQEEEQQEK